MEETMPESALEEHRYDAGVNDDNTNTNNDNNDDADDDALRAAAPIKSRVAPLSDTAVEDARDRFELCVSDVTACVGAVLRDLCPRLQDGIVMAVTRMRGEGLDVASIELATRLVRSDMAVIPDGVMEREIVAATGRDLPELDHVMKATVSAWADCVASEHRRVVTEVPNAPPFISFFRGAACAFVSHVVATEDGDFKGALSFRNAEITDAAVARIVRDAVTAAAPIGYVLRYASVAAPEPEEHAVESAADLALFSSVGVDGGGGGDMVDPEPINDKPDVKPEPEGETLVAEQPLQTQDDDGAGDAPPSGGGGVAEGSTVDAPPPPPDVEEEVMQHVGEEGVANVVDDIIDDSGVGDDADASPSLDVL